MTAREIERMAAGYPIPADETAAVADALADVTQKGDGQDA